MLLVGPASRCIRTVFLNKNDKIPVHLVFLFIGGIYQAAINNNCHNDWTVMIFKLIMEVSDTSSIWSLC